MKLRIARYPTMIPCVTAEMNMLYPKAYWAYVIGEWVLLNAGCPHTTTYEPGENERQRRKRLAVAEYQFLGGVQ